MNPFSPLYAKCNNGAAADKHALLSGGPIIVDVEPVGLCNFRCVFCPTGLKALGRPGGYMSEETFASLIDKTRMWGTAIRLIGWGEPLMHPKIVDFVKAAHDAQRLTHINTNGSKLTRELAEELVEAGLSSIKFSFQGIDREGYESMRRIDFFDGLLETIGILRDARGDSKRPWIAASTTTTTETPEQIATFRALMEPMVDDLTIGHTIFEFIDMAAVPKKRRAELEAAAANEQIVKKHPSPCPEIYDKLTVHWDGAVRVCCNDYSGKTNLGNIVTDSLESIWRHPTIEAYRDRIDAGDYGGPLCSVCWDYQSLTKGAA